MGVKKRVAVCISGTGSNMVALAKAAADPKFPASINLVISDQATAPGLEKARNMGITTAVVERKDFASKVSMEHAIHAHLLKHEVDLVCLAGFMRILGPTLVDPWLGKMLNIHPSLLPAFKGAHAIDDALSAGVRITGCTVHFVDQGMDTGAIIAQAAVPIAPGQSRESLGRDIQTAEHQLYPATLAMLIKGEVLLKKGKAILKVL